MGKNLLTLTAIFGLFVANAAFAEDGHNHSEHDNDHKGKMMNEMKSMDHDCMGEHDEYKSDDGCEDHTNHEKEHEHDEEQHKHGNE